MELNLTENVPLKPGFTQVCVWESCYIPPDKTYEDFENFIRREFGCEAQYLETIHTAPNTDARGKPVKGTGGRTDLFFAVKGDLGKLSVKRFEYDGIRWIEDVLAPGNYRNPIYPDRVSGYKSWTESKNAE